MDNRIKEELNKLINAGRENGGERTTTIQQLLSDLGIYSEEVYNETIDYVEDNIALIVDSTEDRKTFLDSSKESI